GVVLAGEEATETAGLDHHRTAAGWAGFVRDSLLLFLLLQRPAVLALRIAGAGEELAETAPTHRHRPAAEFANLVRKLHQRGRALRASERDLQRLVELGDDRVPRPVARRDLIKLLFHLRREADVHDVGEVIREQLIDVAAKLRWLERAAQLLDVATVDQLG